MKCYLMNKNTEVLLLEYNDILSGFDYVYEIYNISYAPLTISLAYEKNKDILKELNKWFNNRGIPACRDDLERLLYKLRVDTKEELLNKAYGLSLSDQYWIKPIDMEITYEILIFLIMNLIL